jgi:hypothetical protein
MKLLPNQFIRPVSFALAMVLGFVVAYLAWADAGPSQRSSQCGAAAAGPEEQPANTIAVICDFLEKR